MCPKKTEQTVDTKDNNKMRFKHVTVYFAKAPNVFNSPGCFFLLFVKNLFKKRFL